MNTQNDDAGRRTIGETITRARGPDDHVDRRATLRRVELKSVSDWNDSLASEARERRASELVGAARRHDTRRYTASPPR